MPSETTSFATRNPIRARKLRHAAVLGLSLLFAQTAVARVYLSKPMVDPLLIAVEGATTNVETVRLLAGLGQIESDLQLGMLLQSGRPGGSYFARPLQETYPSIKDGLVAAGVPDFQNLLEALEAASSSEEVSTAYVGVIVALAKSRSTMNPSTTDRTMAIVEMTRIVVSEINPAGPTEVAHYQNAWSMLSVARSQLDLLQGDPDPAVVKEAARMAMAMDNVILSMPDPATSAPVDFDPAPVTALLVELQALAGSI